MGSFFLIVFIIILIIFVYHLLHMPLPSGMSVFVGPPGSGKTTIAAYFVKKYTLQSERQKRWKDFILYKLFYKFRWYLRYISAFICLHTTALKLKFNKNSNYLISLHNIYLSSLDYLNRHKSPDSVNIRIWSNVPILGSLQLDIKQDLGQYLVEDGVVLCDEAGIDLNNRAWKSLPAPTIKFTKLYRHYGIPSFVLFSQRLDIDITFIGLCERVFLVRRSRLPNFAFVRSVVRYQDIDENGQLVDKYRYDYLHTYLVYLPPLWKLFDSYEAPYLPEKEWKYWNSKTRYLDDIDETEALDETKENNIEQ